MKMTEQRPLDDRELELLFAATRQSTIRPSDDLLERILHDSHRQSDVTTTKAAPKPRVLDAILTAIGGLPAAAGFVTATAAGIAIGFFVAVPLDELSGGYLTISAGYWLEDILPSFADLISEV